MTKNFNVLITDAAKLDIKNIIDFISKDNKPAAVDVINNFYKTFEILSIYPLTGVIKQDISDKTIRIYTVRKKFSIVYRINKNSVEILRIFTKYQNILAILN